MKTNEQKPPALSRPIHEIDGAMRHLKHQLASGRLAEQINKKTAAALKLESELNALIEEVNLLIHDTNNPAGHSGRIDFDLTYANEANHDALVASLSFS